MGPIARFPARHEEHLVDSVEVELASTIGDVLPAARELGMEAVVVSTHRDDAFGRFVLDVLAALVVQQPESRTYPDAATVSRMVDPAAAARTAEPLAVPG